MTFLLFLLQDQPIFLDLYSHYMEYLMPKGTLLIIVFQATISEL